MWLFTTFGFFSVVQKAGTDGLTVRARVREDLDRLRERLPGLTPTLARGGDYPYRATATHREFGEALARLAGEIDYDNFKDEVYQRQGAARAHAYEGVWETLYGLEEQMARRDFNEED